MSGERELVPTPPDSVPSTSKGDSGGRRLSVVGPDPRPSDFELEASSGPSASAVESTSPHFPNLPHRRLGPPTPPFGVSNELPPPTSGG